MENVPLLQIEECERPQSARPAARSVRKHTARRVQSARSARSVWLPAAPRAHAHLRGEGAGVGGGGRVGGRCASAEARVPPPPSHARTLSVISKSDFMVAKRGEASQIALPPGPNRKCAAARPPPRPTDPFRQVRAHARARAVRARRPEQIFSVPLLHRCNSTVQLDAGCRFGLTDRLIERIVRRAGRRGSIRSLGKTRSGPARARDAATRAHG